MKTILRTRYVAVIIAFAVTFSQLSANAQIYSTRANGDWTNPATWTAGYVPPTGILSVTAVININHSVNYNSSQNLDNFGTIKLVNTTGAVPVLTIPSGKNIDNELTGKFYIIDAELRQYRFVGGGNTGTAQSGTFRNKGGYLEIRNSIVEIAENWINENGGKRIFKKGVLLLGKDYELKDLLTLDTLDKVSVSLGWHNNGDMRLDKGKIVFNQAKIQLAGTNSKFDFKDGIGCGDIDYITFKNHITSVVSPGDLKVDTKVSTTGGLNLDAYCVSAVGKYQPNARFTGSQSLDCSFNYFPSTFMIQQTVNLSAGLGFSAPQPVGTASLAVGAKYKFANVNDTTDAVVTIDSLINGATVSTIDDNTAGTGYGFAFQPKITSGHLVGRSYAVFTISFFKAGTNTPVSLQYINATPLDIDGGSSLKEYAEVAMGAGANMNYMSASSDISMVQVNPGSFRAQNVAGIERDNIDTVSFNNMFTVYNTDMSSFQVKYGTYTSSPTTTTRQFSLYMKGFAYTAVHTLPVKMSSFNALLLNNKKAELKWTTASEINVDNFVVERSTDGSNYSDIGLVFAFGNATSTTNYTFVDDVSLLPAKVIYYRLRSVDIDGKYEYSAIRIIKLSAAATSDIKIITYPNPVRDEVRITIPATWQNKKVSYEVFSANGQPVKKLHTANASQTETFSLRTLAPGFYIVSVTCEGESAKQKIVKH